MQGKDVYVYNDLLYREFHGKRKEKVNRSVPAKYRKKENEILKGSLF